MLRDVVPTLDQKIFKCIFLDILSLNTAATYNAQLRSLEMKSRTHGSIRLARGPMRKNMQTTGVMPLDGLLVSPDFLLAANLLCRCFSAPKMLLPPPPD